MNQKAYAAVKALKILARFLQNCGSVRPFNACAGTSIRQRCCRHAVAVSGTCAYAVKSVKAYDNTGICQANKTKFGAERLPEEPTITCVLPVYAVHCAVGMN